MRRTRYSIAASLRAWSPDHLASADKGLRAVLTTHPGHGPGGRKRLAGVNSNLARASKCDRRGPAMG